MDEVEILVHGNHEFIVQAINGIARLSTSDGTLVGISATVLVLYLAWGFFKQMMDPNAPYPLKEFALGIIMWTFLASPMTPKFDVKIISARDSGAFAVVDDVPLLAAVPAWLATSALSSLREVVEDTFMPVVYSGGSGEIDPLSALVKMYNTPPPSRVLYGSASSEGYDLRKTMNNYMEDCYIADHELDGREPESPIIKMRNTDLTEDFIDSIRVSYNGLNTRIFLDESGSSFGTRVTCPDAFNAIKLAIQSGATENLLEDYYEDKGIRQAAVRDSIALIQGSFGSGVTAYDLQIGMLQSYLVRDGLVGTSYETEVDAMVFQAMRSRVYEKAGEREMFSQISTPVITALESLTFFIYPLYAVLIVLGGMGIKHIGKYMTLLLFINLWGFVKVFVDFYTAISVEQAFAASATFNPLSFDALPSTILEVEGYLATASMLTTTIPMIGMFLLFGGVHSLMGTMKGMTTAKIDGNMGAPSVATSMNAGTRTFADATQQMNSTTGGYSVGHSSLTNSGLGTESLSSVGTTATSATATAAAAQVQSNAQSFESAYSNQINKSNDVQAISQKSSAQEIASSTIDQRVKSLAAGLKQEFGMSGSEATKAAIRLGGEISIGSPTLLKAISPINGKMGLSTNSDKQAEYSEKWADMKSYAKNWQDSLTSKFEGSEKDSLMNQWSNTQRLSNGESNSEVEKAASSFQTSLNRQSALQDAVSNSNGFSSTQSIQWNKAASNANLNTDDFWNKTSEIDADKTNGELLKNAIGINSAADFRALAQQADDGNFNGGLGTDAGAFQTAIKKLMANDGSEDLGRQASDLGLAASMYKFIGSKMSNEDDNGFNMAASALDSRAKMIDSISTENNTLTSRTNTDKPFDTMRQVETAQPIDNTSGVDVRSRVAGMKSNADQELNTDIQGLVDTGSSNVSGGLGKMADKMLNHTPISDAAKAAQSLTNKVKDGIDTLFGDDDSKPEKTTIESSSNTIPNFKAHGGGTPVMPSQVNLESTASPKNEAALYGYEAAKESAKVSVIQDDNGNSRLEKDPYGNFTASDGSSYTPVGDITGADGEYVGEGYIDSTGNYFAYQYGQFVDMGMDDPTKNSY